ncbi:hypothetical protein ABTN40_19640, partial [Acinetobacter baumannii]
YSEEEVSPASTVLADLDKQLSTSPLSTQIPDEIQTFGAMLDDAGHRSPTVKGIADAYRQSALSTQYGPSLKALHDKIGEARIGLASDGTLA